MPTIQVDANRCKGCEHCINHCPQQILALTKQLNPKGYRTSSMRDKSRCIGCRICAISCPEVAIEVFGEGTRYVFFDY